MDMNVLKYVRKIDKNKGGSTFLLRPVERLVHLKRYDGESATMLSKTFICWAYNLKELMKSIHIANLPTC